MAGISATGIRERRTWTGEQRLVAAATLFSVAVLIHNFDHLRRGGSSVSAGVFWLGSLAIINEVGVVVLAYMRHRWAPLAAVAGGLVLAAGYVFVHFTPHRTWLSDSFVSGHPSPISVLAAMFETVASIILAIAGLVIVRRHDRGGVAEGVAGRGDLGRALRHPVVLAMIIGNVIIFAGSLATR
jgi:hypothetical protein